MKSGYDPMEKSVNNLTFPQDTVAWISLELEEMGPANGAMVPSSHEGQKLICINSNSTEDSSP